VTLVVGIEESHQMHVELHDMLCIFWRRSPKEVEQYFLLKPWEVGFPTRFQLQIMGFWTHPTPINRSPILLSKTHFMLPFFYLLLSLSFSFLCLFIKLWVLAQHITDKSLRTVNLHTSKTLFCSWFSSTYTTIITTLTWVGLFITLQIYQHNYK